MHADRPFGTVPCKAFSAICVPSPAARCLRIDFEGARFGLLLGADSRPGGFLNIVNTAMHRIVFAEICFAKI
jgi:hypothetical protein